MKLVALEEHFVTSEALKAWSALDPQWQDPSKGASEEGEAGRRLLEIGPDRFTAMDEIGVDVQVLSLTAPGLHTLPPDDAAALQVPTNDLVAEHVRANPARLQGFATLATPSPDAAARELERGVTRLGLNGGNAVRSCSRTQSGPSRLPADLRGGGSAAGSAISGKAFSTFADDAHSPELKNMMKDGEEEGEQQLDGLRGLLAAAEADQTPASNAVFDALTADGTERVASSSDPVLRDVAVVDSPQLNLLYYIAVYGTMATLATQLDREDDAQIISGMRDHMIAKDEEYIRLAHRLVQASEMETIDAE